MKKQSRSRIPTRLRYSPEAAYARGAETRVRLVAAAMRLFAERGFDAASTRDIATAASLNTPALQYYFNNKEGLYAACAEMVVSEGWTAMKEVVLEAERLLEARADDSQLIEAFCVLQDRLADFLNDANGDWLLWMAREQTRPDATPGYLLKHSKTKRMQGAARALVSRLMGRPLDDAESVLHELGLNGQLLRFYLMRGSALRALKWKAIDEKGLALIKRVARHQSVATLRSLVAARRAGGVARNARKSAPKGTRPKPMRPRGRR